MNYINPTDNSVQLKFNTLANEGESITWSLFLEGSAEPLYTFASTALVDGAYYQILTIDLVSEGLSLQNSTQYRIKGENALNELIYTGKVFTTTQNIYQYTIDGDAFVAPDISNEFIII
jgi:hypothetical protein